jgi:hypothetical protein
MIMRAMHADSENSLAGKDEKNVFLAHAAGQFSGRGKICEIDSPREIRSRRILQVFRHRRRDAAFNGGETARVRTDFPFETMRERLAAQVICGVGKSDRGRAFRADPRTR